MGLEYIRSAAGKPYMKRWARGLNRIKTPTLLDADYAEELRLVTAALAPGARLKPGQTCLVQSMATGELVVLDGLTQVACVARPSAALTEAVNAHHGMLPAVVERVGILSHTAELKLK